MSRIEFIAGLRWARETCEVLGVLVNADHNITPVVDVLKRGLIDKPAEYAKGVQSFINQLQQAAAQAGRGKV
jgi:hypothetical protein